MALIGTSRPTISQGFANEVIEGKLLPCAIWWARNEVTGDATGGNNLLQIIPSSNREFASYLVSVEDIQCNNEDAVARDWDISLNMAMLMEGNARSWRGTTRTVPGQSRAVSVFGDRGSAGGGVGGHSGITKFIWRQEPNLTWSIQAVVPNANLIVDELMVWGYLWDRGVVDQTGAHPVRP